VSIARAEFEHAIAVLIGQPPAEVSIEPEAEQTEPPAVSEGLASTLLERRPDVAAAERRVAAANEEIGVAEAAYFPILSLAAGGGLQATALAELFTEPTRVWSLGVQLAVTIFDGGRRRAQVHLTEAAYDATVANYRQTVLTGFQQVEDALAALRVLSDEAGISVRAVAAAQQSLDLSTTQYRGGLVNYLQVITAQTSLLQNQRASVDIRTRQLVASVSLIQALGGGWDASQLPSAKDVAHGPRSAS
jgi:NodT family efflux transporter outer membrane factor (OMF) lipoprotein